MVVSEMFIYTRSGQLGLTSSSPGSWYEPVGLAPRVRPPSMMLSSFMAAFSSCSEDKCQCQSKIQWKSGLHTKNLVGVGGVSINGVLDGCLILLDGDLVLTSTAGVLVVTSDASGGLGGVLGGHIVDLVGRKGLKR